MCVAANDRPKTIMPSDPLFGFERRLKFLLTLPALAFHPTFCSSFVRAHLTAVSGSIAHGGTGHANRRQD